MFDEGTIEDNAQAPLHFQDGVPYDWTLQAHWDNAGLLVWSVSPVEPVAALLLDLGPIALADYNATLQGSTAGNHLHGVISARPGPWFDWYRDIIDPALRTPSQVARLKAEVAHQLRVALVGALVG